MRGLLVGGDLSICWVTADGRLRPPPRKGIGMKAPQFSFVVALLLLASQSAPADSVCRKMARASAEFTLGVVRYAVVTYPKEAYATRGRSLFLKPAEPLPSDTRWFGILTKPLPEAEPKSFFLRNHFSPILQALPRRLSGGYDFTPFQALHRHTIDRATRSATHRLLGQEMKWTIPVYLLAGVGFGLLTNPLFEAAKEAIVDEAFARAFEKRAPEWDALIEGDYRYDDLRLAVEMGDLSPGAARAEAMARNRLFVAYFDFMARNPEASFDAFAELPHFADIAWLREYGVQEHPGLRKLPEFSREITAAQAQALASHLHEYFAVSEAIWLWLHEPETYRRMSDKEPALGELIRTIERDPFNRKLEVLEGEGKISKAERGRLLQEDAYWQRTFADWQTLRVEKRKKQNGVYLESALTLEDIRTETLEEIGRP